MLRRKNEFLFCNSELALLYTVGNKKGIKFMDVNFVPEDKDIYEEFGDTLKNETLSEESNIDNMDEEYNDDEYLEEANPDNDLNIKIEDEMNIDNESWDSDEDSISLGQSFDLNDFEDDTDEDEFSDDGFPFTNSPKSPFGPIPPKSPFGPRPFGTSFRGSNLGCRKPKLSERLENGTEPILSPLAPLDFNSSDDERNPRVHLENSVARLLRYFEGKLNAFSLELTSVSNGDKVLTSDMVKEVHDLANMLKVINDYTIDTLPFMHEFDRFQSRHQD